MKSILLARGFYAHVDDEWYDYLMQWKWYKHKTGYAVRGEGGRTVLMHRVINETPEGLQTDHIDGDRLNNQSLNLRSVTDSQNFQNKRIQSNNKLGIKGVSPHRNKFQAAISVNGKSINLGTYLTPEEAKTAYDNAVDEYFGEYGRK